MKLVSISNPGWNLTALVIAAVFVVGCQPRPKAERTVQIIAGKNSSEKVTQSTTPVPILAGDRTLQTMKLARILIAGIMAKNLPEIPGCGQWSLESDLLTFVDCTQGKVSFSGEASLKRNTLRELQGFDLQINVTEFDKVGSSLIQTKTKMDLDIAQLQPLGRAEDGSQGYEGSLRLTEDGEDLGKRKRSVEVMASKVRLAFQGTSLESFRILGQASAKIQREKTRVSKALWMINGKSILFQEQARFWKGGFSFAESADSGVPRTEVVFAEGMISIPKVKDLPVFCRAEKSDLEELQCLMSDLYRSGPGE